jgi:hypothetical protein
VVAMPAPPRPPVPVPVPAPAPMTVPPFTPPADPVALAQLVALFRERLMSTQYPSPAPMPAPPNDLVALLQQVLSTLHSTGAGAPVTTAPPAEQQVEQLRKLVEIIAAIVAPSPNGDTRPLVQVNGALGQTIGNLLDGKRAPSASSAHC